MWIFYLTFWGAFKTGDQPRYLRVLQYSANCSNWKKKKSKKVLVHHPKCYYCRLQCKMELHWAPNLKVPSTIREALKNIKGNSALEDFYLCFLESLGINVESIESL